jgi:hypothetical protein
MPVARYPTAADVMLRAAILLNDPEQTDYTTAVLIPYVNMAAEELQEHLEEANAAGSNFVSEPITVPIGMNRIPPPVNLVELIEVSERSKGATGEPFLRMSRHEFVDAFPPNNSLLVWAWQDQMIRFNPNGALTVREVQLKYTGQIIVRPGDVNSQITLINSVSYLAYKTAALCAQFIGENESRAELLERKAELALERMLGIENKGRQQIMTRHRPFRASYKSRSSF